MSPVYMAESSYWASLVAQMVKNHLQCGRHSLGWEDPQEEGMATHSSILAWRIPCTEEPGRQQSSIVESHRTKQLTLSELN